MKIISKLDENQIDLVLNLVLHYTVRKFSKHFLFCFTVCVFVHAVINFPFMGK